MYSILTLLMANFAIYEAHLAKPKVNRYLTPLENYTWTLEPLAMSPSSFRTC